MGSDSYNLAAEIDRLSRRRHELWAQGGGPDPHEVGRISARLHEAYEELRLARAAEEVGGRKRADIVRQARVESELERLMTR